MPRGPKGEKRPADVIGNAVARAIAPGADGRESRQRVTGMRPMFNRLRRRKVVRELVESDARALIERFGDGG